MSALLSGRSVRAFYREARKRARIRSQRKRSIEGLANKGLVETQGDIVYLTQKGKELQQILQSKTGPEGTWDESWWIVMYDIPTSINAFRFELRRILIQSGFRKLQHSVWIHPRPCLELEFLMRAHPRLSKYIRYLKAPPFTHMKTITDWKKLSAV